MDRKEMLKELNVSEHELDDFLKKVDSFFSSLDEKQKELFKRSTASLNQAVAAFGGRVGPDELLRLFGGGAGRPPVIVCVPFVHHKTESGS